VPLGRLELHDFRQEHKTTAAARCKSVHLPTCLVLALAVYQRTCVHVITPLVHAWQLYLGGVYQAHFVCAGIWYSSSLYFIPASFFLAYFFPFSATNRLLRLNHLREQLPQRIQALLGCEYPLGYLKLYFGVFLEISVELDVEELLFCQYVFASEFDSRTYRCVRVVEEVFEVV
jgi:hypothetical protein